MGPHRGVDVQDRPADPGVVQHVLGPSVVDARHDAEEVLHRQGHAGPVVRLHLGERDDPIELLQGRGQGQVRQGRLPEPVGHQHDVVVIQVDELEPRLRQDGPHPRFLQDELGVAAVTRALGHDHPACAPAPEDLGRRAHDGRMGVDLRRIGARLDQVRLEQDRLAPDRRGSDAQLTEPRAEDRLQVGAIRRRPGDQDRGAQETLGPVAHQVRRQADRRGSGHPRQERPALHTSWSLSPWSLSSEVSTHGRRRRSGVGIHAAAKSRRRRPSRGTQGSGTED